MPSLSLNTRGEMYGSDEFAGSNYVRLALDYSYLAKELVHTSECIRSVVSIPCLTFIKGNRRSSVWIL